MSKKHALLALGFYTTTCLVYAQQPTATHFDGKSWWKHIEVLADDNMEGRDTGSPGLRKAEAYVVQQLQGLGLRPAGTSGFHQKVKFVSRQVVESESSAALVQDGRVGPLTLGEDAFFPNRIDQSETEINAPLVFVGYGLKVPEMNYNDFADVDLKGKVAVILTGSPAEFPPALASHYQTVSERWKSLRAAGAIGTVTIANPVAMDVPWSRSSLNRNHPGMALDYPEFNESEGEKLSMVFNPAKAERLFAGTGHTFQELATLAKDRKSLPHFPLQVSLRARTKMTRTRLESNNLVAVLPGTDPKLKNEYMVLSAHIDHVGIGEPIDGDRIYNGAMDNASGSALLLDVASSLVKSGEKLRRSVLFVFVTGEEKGLLGSKYFSAHPTVDQKSMVADLNVDMFLPIVPMKVLTVYGLTESDLGDRVTEVAKGLGVRVQPDPEPLRNVFIRSDQYNFIRHGVPALAMGVGFDPGSPEAQTFKEWRTRRYHAPSDDLQQPVNLSTAAEYEEICRGVVVSVANGDGRPHWKADSFFRRYEQQGGN